MDQFAQVRTSCAGVCPVPGSGPSRARRQAPVPACRPRCPPEDGRSRSAPPRTSSSRKPLICSAPAFQPVIRPSGSSTTRATSVTASSRSSAILGWAWRFLVPRLRNSSVPLQCSWGCPRRPAPTRRFGHIAVLGSRSLALTDIRLLMAVSLRRPAFLRVRAWLVFARGYRFAGDIFKTRGPAGLQPDADITVCHVEIRSPALEILAVLSGLYPRAGEHIQYASPKPRKAAAQAVRPRAAERLQSGWIAAQIRASAATTTST